MLEREGAARFPGTRGRIPNFRGAEQAAKRLAQLSEWQAAHVVKANPDSPQLPVRRRAHKEAKTLYMAVPRLANDRPFVEVRGDPTIKRTMSEGKPLRLAELKPVDLIVCGSVAVNREGARIGKGGGYSDLELALLLEHGLVGKKTTIATTVHPLQLLEEVLPETEHDFRVDAIVTPAGVVRTRAHGRPPGILWDHLRAEKCSAIPALRSHPRAKRHTSGDEERR